MNNLDKMQNTEGHIEKCVFYSILLLLEDFFFFFYKFLLTRRGLFCCPLNFNSPTLYFPLGLAMQLFLEMVQPEVSYLRAPLELSQMMHGPHVQPQYYF